MAALRQARTCPSTEAYASYISASPVLDGRLHGVHDLLTAPRRSREARRDQGARARRRKGCEDCYGAPDRIRLERRIRSESPFAPRSSTSPCAASRSARSRTSSASSTTAPSCRSPSSSTSTPPAGALRVPPARARVRGGAGAAPRGTDRCGDRDRGAPARAGRAIFARAHAGPRPSEDEALFRTVLLGLWFPPPRRVAASTGTTTPSIGRTPSSSGRSSASGARTPQSRRSSASRWRRSSSLRLGCGCER